MKLKANYKQDEQGQWWRYGKEQRYRAIISICEECGEEFPGGAYERNRFCGWSCTGRFNGRHHGFKNGSLHYNWKGGRYINQDGYIMARVSGHPRASKGYIFEHRFMMERYLGRYLQPWEVVHHKNGDRADNRIENLELWGLWNGRQQPPGQRAADIPPPCPTCGCTCASKAFPSLEVRGRRGVRPVYPSED